MAAVIVSSGRKLSSVHKYVSTSLVCKHRWKGAEQFQGCAIHYGW